MKRSNELEDWVARVRGRLVRSARALLKDEGEAENVVQATLLSVWQAHQRGARFDLDSYAARAVWLNALRLRGRRSRWALPADAPSEEAQVQSPDALELTSWELERAILGLPPAQQVVIRLRFYSGLSFQEIGEALAISMNTAASRCRYALDALRAAFRHPPKEEVEEDESTRS